MLIVICKIKIPSKVNPKPKRKVNLKVTQDKDIE